MHREKILRVGYYFGALRLQLVIILVTVLPPSESVNIRMLKYMYVDLINKS